MSNEATQSLFAEVSKWKLEAAEEESKRYFFHIEEVNSLESGENSIVIGRKGTGKTAICRYFEQNISYDRFSIKLSFKEFPFNLLYNLEDKSFTVPSQYISLWKYFIYNAVLKMMITNEKIDAKFKSTVMGLYSDSELAHIHALMSTWTNRSFGINLLGVAANYAVERKERSLESCWPDLIPAIEKFIVNHVDDSKYFVVFDELDEDYRNYWDAEERSRYIALITSLFKAVSNVRRVFTDHQCDIRPIIFLRDDIYDLLADPDKNKWEDHKINLSWTKDSIKKMLAFRIARSMDKNANQFSFDAEWEKLFHCRVMPIGNAKGGGRKRVHSFDYIMELTHNRPRDFVRFLRDGARLAMKQGHRGITEDTIRGVDVEFSDHFRQELVNEISGILPDINQILSYLGNSHKQRYRYDDFIIYLRRYQQGDECHKDTNALTTETIAKILFHFSIIGNASRHHSRPHFKYQRTHFTLNPSEPVVIHRGLLRTLGLY